MRWCCFPGLLVLAASQAFDAGEQESTASTFLDLARERFEARNGRPATFEENAFAFDGLQLIRVPKAGSSEASVIARRLGGCVPRGPCCRFPGDPPGSCPLEGLMCPMVTGCTSHRMDPTTTAMLEDPSVFSMTNIRGVVDRMVSGFFYTDPHSPPCAWKDDVIEFGGLYPIMYIKFGRRLFNALKNVEDYEACFQKMITTRKFQNIAARMVSGHDAYKGGIRLCMDKDQDEGGEGVCVEDLESVIRGACNLNFVTMCETWDSSVLLLFETLPWLGPTADFFPAPKHQHRQLPSIGDAEAPAPPEDPATSGRSRQNTGAKHEEGIKHITPELREAASSANAVDEALHEFVSAKFCERLREAGLLHHPLVAAQLATYEPLDHRCNDETWAKETLERFAPITPQECRLYEPFEKP